MQSFRALPGAVAGLVLLIAHAAGAQRSDTVVRNVTAPKFAAPKLVAVWKIGTASGTEETQLNGVRGMLVTTDGNLWVIDYTGMTPSLRVFDASGKFVRRVGRGGSGPGEFNSANGIAQLPDGRILLRDQNQSRINVYRPDGASDTTWTLTSNYSWPSNGGGGIVVDPRGVVWLVFSDDVGPTSTRAYARLQSNGRLIDTVKSPVVAFVKPVGIEMQNAGGRGGYFDGDPNAPSAVQALSPLGYFVTGINKTYAFEILQPRAGAAAWKAGDPVVSVRRTGPLPAVGAEERENIRAIRQFRIDRGKASGMTLVHGIPELSTTKRAYDFIRFTADGRMLVSASTPSEKYEPQPPTPELGFPARTGPQEPLFKWRAKTAYDVFEPDGTYLGRLDVFPSYMRGDNVYVVSTDDDGINYITKYRIGWTGK